MTQAASTREKAAKTAKKKPESDKSWRKLGESFKRSFVGMFEREESNFSEADDSFNARDNKSKPAYDSLCQIFPYTGYDDKTGLFLIEGADPSEIEGIGFVIELNQQTGASEEMAKALADMLQRVGHHKVAIQVTAFGSPDLGIQFSAMRSLVDTKGVRPIEDPKIDSKERQVRIERFDALRELNERRINYYNKGAIGDLFSGHNFRMRECRTFASVCIPSKEFNDTVVMKAQELRQLVRTSMSVYYLTSFDWTASDLIYFLGLVLNPQRTLFGDLPIYGYDEGIELRRQVVHRNTRWTEETDHFKVNDGAARRVVVKAMSPLRFPETLKLPNAYALLTTKGGDNYPGMYLLTTGVMFPDYDSQKSKTTMKAMRAQQTADSQLAKFLPNAHEVNQDFKIALQVYSNGGREVGIYHQLMLFSREEDASRMQSVAEQIYRSVGFELTRDVMINKACLLASVPMTFGPLLQRDFKLLQKTSSRFIYNGANILPLIGDYKGTPARERETTPRPVLTMFGKTGQFQSYDLFANPSGNYNAAVVGTSGSGKSAFCNELLMRSLASGDRAWVIDVGGSYKKLCAKLAGRYIQFGRSERINLNPFALFQNVIDGSYFEKRAYTQSEIDQESEDLDMLFPVFEQMASPSEPLSDWKRAQLSMHIVDVMASSRLNGRIAIMDDLADSLINNCGKGDPTVLRDDPDYVKRVQSMPHEERSKLCDPAIRQLGQVLSQFSTLGNYGEYFNGTEPVKLQSDQFVVLELEELNNRPALRSVVLMLLMRLITNEMYLGDRGQGKIVLIDEAWDLLREGGEGTGKFIETGYRRARKYGGSFITATQSMEDYSKSALARACLENADWLFLLRQKKESITALKDNGKLQMDEYTEYLIRSLRTESGRYSEIFVRCGDIAPAVGRLYFDPFTLLLSSSKAEDVDDIQQKVDTGLSMTEAILAVLKERNIHV